MEFLPKFREEEKFRPKFRLHRISAEISGRKGILAKPKPQSKIEFRFPFVKYTFSLLFKSNKVN